MIISTSIEHGPTRGLQAVAGTSLAMMVQLAIAALGTSWLLQLLSDAFYIFKWLGVVYLFYLGLTHLKALLDTQDHNVSLSPSATFSRGFIVSLTNPKTILFFSAFFPQFVWSQQDYLQQIGILSSIFFLMAVALDSAYAILSSQFKSLLKGRHVDKMQNGVSALLYLSSSVCLALTRRN